MADDERPPSTFKDFDARVAKAKGRPDGESAAFERNRSSGWGQGLQAGIEILAGVVVGALIGYALDSWLGTRPWLSILFFMLGGAAGLMNAYRQLQRALAGSEGKPGGSGKQ